MNYELKIRNILYTSRVAYTLYDGELCCDTCCDFYAYSPNNSVCKLFGAFAKYKQSGMVKLPVRHNDCIKCQTDFECKSEIIKCAWH